MGSLGSSPRGLSLPCQPRMFLPPSPPWPSWEKKVLPDLDFSWVPQVLPLIGRLISNLVTCACKGRRCPKGSLCLMVPDLPCLLCLLLVPLLFKRASLVHCLLCACSWQWGKLPASPVLLSLDFGVKSALTVAVMS